MNLLDDLKDRLRITWDDDDANLLKLIDRSESYLSQLTGATFDFNKDVWVTDLLLERCRYVHNNAADEFEINFKHELKRLILYVATGIVGELNYEQTDP